MEYGVDKGPLLTEGELTSKIGMEKKKMQNVFSWAIGIKVLPKKTTSQHRTYAGNEIYGI